MATRLRQALAHAAPDAARIPSGATAGAGLPGALDLRASCESTNAVAMAAPKDLLSQHGWLLVASEQQTSGRGRLDRRWESPAGAGLLFSLAVPLAPELSPRALGLVPLSAGLAVAEVCRELGVPAGVKWPNDVILPALSIDGQPGKLAGILAELGADRVVIGVGLNVDLTPAEAPTPQAVSLAEHGLGRDVGREELLAALVARLLVNWRLLNSADGAAGPSGEVELLARYRALCDTLGRRVRVLQPGGRELVGQATDIDASGHLMVSPSPGSAPIVVQVGDVVHVRSDGDA